MLHTRPKALVLIPHVVNTRQGCLGVSSPSVPFYESNMRESQGERTVTAPTIGLTLPPILTSSSHFLEEETVVCQEDRLPKVTQLARTGLFDPTISLHPFHPAILISIDKCAQEKPSQRTWGVTGTTSKGAVGRLCNHRPHSVRGLLTS